MSIFAAKKIKFSRCVAVIMALAMAFFAQNSIAKNQQEAVLHVMRGQEEIVAFQVEIATSREEKIRGLMFREQMPRHHGMIFYYAPPTDAQMWMKNTLIPLDMLFIDENQRIVHIHHSATPHSLVPIGAGQPVAAIIEINGGEAQSEKIQVGDKIIINNSIKTGVHYED
jgi:uncharacterized membrane protein (UPF0127 family)